MKIQTLNDLQDKIDSEMAWRKKELSALKSNIQSSRAFAKNTAIRAGMALLYAHWEGAIKNIAYYYLCFVSFQKMPYNKLKNNFLAITIKHELSLFIETNKTTLQTTIIDKLLEMSNKNSQIPITDKIISTKSNLNSDIFKEIMCTIGLKTDYYEQSYKLIDEVLLSKRNDIAHGERLETIDLDEKRYNEIHDKIFDLIDYFSNQVMNAACQKIYLAENEEKVISS